MNKPTNKCGMLRLALMNYAAGIDSIGSALRVLEAVEGVDKKKCLEFMYSIAYDWGTLPVFKKLLTFLESLPDKE